MEKNGSKQGRPNKAHRNVAGDRRANSLKLRPTKPQTNGFAHFEMARPASDIDIVTNDRVDMCLKIRRGK